MRLKAVCSIQKEPTPNHELHSFVNHSSPLDHLKDFFQSRKGKAPLKKKPQKLISKQSILTLPENFTFPKVKVKHYDLPSCFSPPFCAITCNSRALHEFGMGARLCSASAEHTQLPARSGSEPQLGRRDTAPSKAEGRELLKG